MAVFGGCALLCGALSLLLPETLGRELPGTVREAIHFGEGGGSSRQDSSSSRQDGGSPNQNPEREEESQEEDPGGRTGDNEPLIT